MSHSCLHMICFQLLKTCHNCRSWRVAGTCHYMPLWSRWLCCGLCINPHLHTDARYQQQMLPLFSCPSLEDVCANIPHIYLWKDSGGKTPETRVITDTGMCTYFYACTCTHIQSSENLHKLFFFLQIRIVYAFSCQQSLCLRSFQSEELNCAVCN